MRLAQAKSGMAQVKFPFRFRTVLGNLSMRYLDRGIETSGDRSIGARCTVVQLRNKLVVATREKASSCSNRIINVVGVIGR